MVWLVIEKSMGFGSGGWDTGFHIYIICRGKVIRRIRTRGLEPTLGTLKFALKLGDVGYKIRRVGYPPKKPGFCKALKEVLCEETKGEIR